jgi:hypothetical protein
MADVNYFAQRMRYWCDEGNLGYDQSNRWDVRYGGETDCSALVIHCLQEAGFDTGDASYTGDLSANLTAWGWERLAFDANSLRVGDIILNDVHHVVAVTEGSGASCLVSYASIDENGNASGGKAGDQTDRETLTRSLYYPSYGWDCILRYKQTQERGANVQLFEGNGTDAQRWRVNHNDDGTCTFVAVSCGLALDVADAGTASGTPVRAWTPNGTDAQKWRVLQKADGVVYEPANVAPIALAPKVNEGLRLDACGGGTGNGTGVQVYDLNNTEAQLWSIIDHGDGTWTFCNANASKFLDVENGGN